MTLRKELAPRARKDRNWELGSTLLTIVTEYRWNRPRKPLVIELRPSGRMPKLPLWAGPGL